MTDHYTEGVPRACGDDPYRGRTYKTVYESSPRLRG